MNIPLLPNTVHLYEQLAEWKTRLRNTAGFSCATPPLPSIHVWEAGVNKVQLWHKGIMESCGKGGVIIPPSIIGLMLKRNSVTPAWRMLSCSCVVVLGLWRGGGGILLTHFGAPSAGQDNKLTWMSCLFTGTRLACSKT